MSVAVSEATHRLLKKLICVVTGYKDDTNTFEKLERKVVSLVEKSDSMDFKNRDEMDRMMESLGDKFLFHGFKPQAKQLLSLYAKFMDEVSTFYDPANKRSIVRFIVAMANSPTNNYYKYNKSLAGGDAESQINWPEYLQEGIPKWSTVGNESDSEWSDDSDISLDSDDGSRSTGSICLFKPLEAKREEIKSPYEMYRESKQKLTEKVQHTWFNSENVREKPPSEDQEANIAFLWDDYVNKVTGGLIPEVKTRVVSEYKVMRELIWQFYEPTSCVCFELLGDRLVLRNNVTISSLREACFKKVMDKFLPHIETVQSLRDFESSVNNFDITASREALVPCNTYKNYCNALHDILEPFFESLREVEEEVSRQETICTLLTIHEQLKPAFETIETLKNIHDQVTVDYKTNSAFVCASVLLARLNAALTQSATKLEQDIVVTMYLEGLRKYLGFVESWLVKDVFEDDTGEFIIEEGEDRSEKSLDFKVKDLEGSCQGDNVLAFFSTEVLQIGRNVHLLRLLGKSGLMSTSSQFEVNGRSLFEDYVDAVLKEMSSYFKSEESDGKEEEVEEMVTETTTEGKSTFEFAFPVYLESKRPTEFDKLENLVDMSNGFLVGAFHEYFKEKTVEAAPKKQSLYQRVSTTLKSLCPIKQILENVLFNLFEERFSISGTLAKNLLVTEYKLEEYFKFFKRVFLFQDEVIFPLYRKFLKCIDSGIEVNELWLTAQLQDILMDVHPSFVEACRVELKEYWDQYIDPLKMCSIVKIRATVEWPIDLIIREEHLGMYLELFQFILQIKWGLYTLNRLYFTDLEPKSKSAPKPSRAVQRSIAKLKILRFALVNDLSSVQHYILGYVFNKYNGKFEQEFKDSYDFDSLLRAHDEFITNLHKECMYFRLFQKDNKGIYMLLYMTKKLATMWRNVTGTNSLEIDKYLNWQRECHKVVDSLISRLQSLGNVDN